MNKYLVGICAYNEGKKIERVVKRFNDYQCYDVLIIDDGSDDGSIDAIRQGFPFAVIRNDTTRGAGYGTRQIIEYGLKSGYDAVFFVAGNDKDDPKDIDKLKAAIEDGFDLVQGSRYLPGGEHGNMPQYRKVATRIIHPVFFSLLSGRRITDSTNGFRAVRISMMEDDRFQLSQSWLDHYELEPYLFYKAIKLGYKVKEVPVRKIYPPKEEGYSKMKPIIGWWSILRPLILLALKIKK